MHNAVKIYCIGGIAIDRKLKSVHKLQLGTSNLVSSFSTIGGVAHNVAKNLRQLTDQIHLQSVVGHDSEGLQILSYLKNQNIYINDMLMLENESTARYDVILDREGELYLALADMDIFDRVPHVSFTKCWDAWCEQDIIFLDTNLPAMLLEYAIQKSKEKNNILCIDPVSVSKTKKLPACLENVFLIKPDCLEAECLTNIKINSIADCIHAGKLILDKGAQNCVISLGKAGYVIINESMQTHFSVNAVNPIVDVSGAGDAFIAGIIYELKHGSDIAKACQTGAIAAAMTLQSQHTVSAMITPETLSHAYIKQQERHYA